MSKCYRIKENDAQSVHPENEWPTNSHLDHWSVIDIITHTQPFYSSLDFVWDNPGEQVPKETFTNSHLSLSSTILYMLPPSIAIHATSLFNLHAWQSFCTIAAQVFFRLPLGLAPSTLYSIHFFTQSSMISYWLIVLMIMHMFRIYPRRSVSMVFCWYTSFWSGGKVKHLLIPYFLTFCQKLSKPVHSLLKL